MRRQPDPNLFYTRVRMAQVLGVSVATLDKWRSLGIGPPWIKPGGVKYPIKGYNEWEAEERRDGNKKPLAAYRLVLSKTARRRKHVSVSQR
jgi:hypothetical protein